MPLRLLHRTGNGRFVICTAGPSSMPSMLGAAILIRSSNFYQGLPIWSAVDLSNSTCKRTVMPCKAYLIDMLLVQAGNDKQCKVWLVLHLHHGAKMLGYDLESRAGEAEDCRMPEAQRRLKQLCRWMAAQMLRPFWTQVCMQTVALLANLPTCRSFEASCWF